MIGGCHHGVKSYALPESTQTPIHKFLTFPPFLPSPFLLSLTNYRQFPHTYSHSLWLEFEAWAWALTECTPPFQLKGTEAQLPTPAVTYSCHAVMLVLNWFTFLPRRPFLSVSTALHWCYTAQYHESTCPSDSPTKEFKQFTRIVQLNEPAIGRPHRDRSMSV